MDEADTLGKKPSVGVKAESGLRLLVGRHEAARMLSISERALDYLIANKQLSARRIGSRVLLSVSDLQRYARADHPKPVAQKSA